MKLRELVDWVTIQGSVHIKELFDDELESILYVDDFEYETISEDILELYVKYMYVANGVLQIEVYEEKY